MGANNLIKWTLFRKIAAISGIIQGFTWLVMAAICIGMYYGKMPEGYKKTGAIQLNANSSYTDLISFCFYDTLLYKENNWEDRYLRAKNFHVFAWLYAILSLCWFSLALTECIGLFRRKAPKYDAHILMLSGSTIALVSILDIIVMSLAFRDYFQINVFKYDVFDWDGLRHSLDFVLRDENGTGSQDVFEANIDPIFRYKIGRKISYGILITLCARGFVIWIFNCVSGFILMLISSEVFRAPPILKYDNRSIPRPKITSYAQKDRHTLFGSSFAEDYDRFSTPPSEKRGYSVPVGDPMDRYGHEPQRNNPLALSSKNRRNENMFS